MATDSSVAGYLAPATNPVYDQELEDIFQLLIQGLTKIPGNLVRPRYQPDPPNMPGFDVNWIAFGVVIGAKQWDAFQKFDPLLGAEGSYVVEGSEELKVTLSFYGPLHEHYQRLFEDGLQLEQNRDAIAAHKIKYKGVDPPVNVPALFKQRWVTRSDVTATFNRWCTRIYPVLTIRSAGVDLDNESYVEHIQVDPPSSP